MKKRNLLVCIGTFWLLLAGTSMAATVPYTFEVNIDSGPLIGNSYSGSFSYDDSDPLGLFGDRPLLDFEFTFEGASYVLVDDLFGPAAFFSPADEFLGVEYSASSTGYEIAFTPGFGSITEVFFGYTDLNTFDGGFGDITYSVVPVPAAVWLFGSGLIGLLGFARRKKT